MPTDPARQAPSPRTRRRGGSGEARPGTRPTPDGWILGLLTLALSAVAAASGNNLLYLTCAGLWATGGVAVGLGRWNLRGLTVRRVLPADLFAGADARGRLVVHNRRRWLPAVDLAVEDDAGGRAHLGAVEPGAEGSAAASWVFERRGTAELRRIAVRSTFPFGLVEHVVIEERPVEVVVYSAPAPGRCAVESGPLDGDRASSRSRGRDGDFAGLRDYRIGDRPSAIHRASSARTGQLLVVQGSGEAEPQVDVVVRDRGDREEALSIGAGEVIDGFRRGLRVGLVLPGFDDAPAQRLPPSGGLAWRRSLLEALARVPPEAR